MSFSSRTFANVLVDLLFSDVTNGETKGFLTVFERFTNAKPKRPTFNEKRQKGNTLN